MLPYLSYFIYKLIGKHKLRSKPLEISCQPFFILGSGRNGSTLLSMILNGHSNIFIPGEQFALHYASMRFQLYNFLIWRDLVKIIIGEFADNKNTQGWDVNFGSLYDKLYRVPKKERSLQRIIDAIIQEAALQKHKTFSLWGDKTPSTIWYIKYIYRLYPHSKYVFLVRDGRDVVNSYKNGGIQMFDDLSDIETAARNWQASINNWKWLNTKVDGSQLFTLHYENLVLHPEIEIPRLLKFLKLNYNERILDYESVVRNTSILDIPYHQGLAHPVNDNSVGKWKKELSEDQLLIALPIIEQGLKEFGYLT